MRPPEKCELPSVEILAVHGGEDVNAAPQALTSLSNQEAA